jgi:S-adenosylhomocysteine hydrolase
MSHFTRTMQQALDTVRTMRPEQQDLIAVEILERVRMLTQPATKLTAEERAELEAELAAARRGELASDAEVAAMFAKHGV